MTVAQAGVCRRYVGGLPGQVQMKLEQAELARLRRAVIKLKTERDIFEKAVTYFSKEAR